MARRLVVEADGASRGNPGEAAYGAVVRDAATGEPLAEVAEYIGTATNNVAEYRGLIAGLREASRIDSEASVVARLDSRLVVEQMSGRWRIKHPDLRPLADAARASVRRPDAVSFEWVPRERNQHADRLANEALDEHVAGRVWRSGPAIVDGVPAAPRAADLPAASRPTWRASVPGGPDLGAPTTLLLLRHGSTELTPHHLFSGIGDPPLSDRGRAEAEAAARRLATRGGVDVIVSSPSARALDTARAASRALGVDVHVEQDLHETDFGEWEGLSFAQAKERWPAELDAWLAGASAPPGGESFQAVATRVRDATRRLLARYPRATVLVVSHVTPIKVLICDALGAPTTAMFRMELSAASLSVVAYFADGAASLRLCNDTGHLAGLTLS